VLPPGTRVVQAGEGDLASVVGDALIVVGDWTHQVHIGAEVIAGMRACRLIQQPSAGYENIDDEAAARAGIAVANAGPANAAAVAEHALLLALGCVRHLREAVRDGERGGWNQQDWVARNLPELGSRTVGILGLGAIGERSATLFRAFGCRVLYNKRHRLDAEREAQLGVTYADLDGLCAASEVLVLSLPLNPETRGILNADRLAMLPPGAIVVNVARGGLLDYDALGRLLRSGHLGGAGLDVYPVEPPPPGHGLDSLPNVILTPHIGGTTQQAAHNILTNSIENLNRVLRGEAPLHVVNGVGV
jgi:phosphoglycerate dehydrogenase-like enzyme